MIETVRTKDDALERPLFHFADVVANKIRIGNVPPVLDDLLGGTRLGDQTLRKEKGQLGCQQDRGQTEHLEHRQTPGLNSSIAELSPIGIRRSLHHDTRVGLPATMISLAILA